MMMIPRKKNEFNLFDEMFNDPFFNDPHPIFERTQLMKTDIKESKDSFEINIDLPGFNKEDISLSIEDGYLSVSAKTQKIDDDKNSRYIKKERFYGECSRSFYIGEDISEDEIKANFRNGILVLIVPKKEQKAIEKKKFIEIGD